MRLTRDFFSKPTLEVSKNLLGKLLVRQIGKRKLIGKIVETEAYIGPEDKASHAAFGKTKRCAPMYKEAGIAYVYFIYGMYWMLNVVTEEKGKPCAVLIRAVEPIEPIGKEYKDLTLAELRKLGSGPGKLTRWLQIDGSFNGEDLTRSQRLWFEASADRDAADRDGPCQIVKAKRIGVDYAGEWKDKEWRFYLKHNPFVSKK